MAKVVRNTTMRVKFDVNDKGLNDADKRIQDTARELEKLESTSRKTATGMNKTSESVRDLEKETSRANHTAKEQARAISGVNDKNEKNVATTQKATESVKSRSKAVEEASVKEKKHAQTTEETAKSTEKLSEKNNLLRDSFLTIGAAVATKAIYEFGKAAVVVGMDFDASMSKVQAVAGATGKELQTMRDQAIQLGADTTKSAKEVAEGQLELAKSGMSAKQAMDAIPGAISASEASGEDMAVAVNVMTSALNGFQLKASESAHVADVLAEAANRSKADINDMGYAFKYAATPAKALGITLEETSAAVMIMTNAGLAGEQAGTSLRSALISLAKPTDAATKQMDALGVSITDSKGNMKPLSGIMDGLRKSTSGMGNAQKLAALSTIFGTEAASGMLAIIDSAPGTMQKFTKSLEESDGASKRASDTMTDNLAGSVEEMMGAFESAQIAISDVFTPAVRKGVDTVADLVDGFNDLSPSAKSMVVWGGLIVGGVLPVSFAVYKVWRAVRSVSTVMAGAKAFFASYNADLARTGTQASITAAQVERLNRAQTMNTTVLSRSKKAPIVAGGGTFASVGKNGVGQVGKGGLLKTGGGVLAKAGKFGKGIPILGTALGIGAIAMGGTENIGANIGGVAGGIGGGALAGATIGTVAGPVGTAVGGTIGAIAGAIGGEKFGSYLQTSIKKHWPKDSLKSTLGEKVSKDTASAIKAYEKLNTSATNELNMLAWSSEKITAKNSKSLKDKYSNMASTIKTNMNKRFKETSKVISGALANAKLTKGEKASLIDNLNDYHKKAEKEVDRSERKIKRILEKAKREKRALTKEERQEINKEQEKMREAAVKTLSKSAKEQRTIMSQLKADASGLSAKQAAAVVRNSKKARDGAIKEANKKYKDVIAAADREYYDNKSISKAQYDAIVKAAKKTKEESISNAEEQHQKVVDQAKKQAGAQVSQVNWSTGEMLSKWDKFKIGLANVINAISKGVNNVLSAFGIDKKIPMWNPSGSASAKADVSKSSSNKGVPIGAYASGTSYHGGGPAVVGEEGPELVYTPYGNARLVGMQGAEITNLERGAKVLTASQTRQMMSGGLNGTMPGYAGGTVGASIKEAGQAVWDTTKKAGAYVKDKASDAYDTAKNVATSVYDFAADPSSAIDKIISKYKYKDVLGVGKAAVKKTKDAAVEYIQDKLGAFMGGGDMGVAGGSITNSYGIYDSLFNIAKQIMASPLGRGLSITSGHRPGDPHDHGKHNAVDLSGFGSNGGYKAVAQWASRLPGVSYTIGDNTVFGRKYGDGGRPNWATGHMNHVHVSGAASNASGGGSASAWSAQIRQAAKQMKVKLSPSELNGIIAQIKRESNGNQSIVQSSAVNDINMRNGNPARGLLQYIPSTFRNYAVKGHTNIMSGYDQLLAFFNNSSWRSDLPYGRSGWGPRGKRRFESGGWKTVDGQVLVGEKGPELVDLPNNSHVNNNTRTNEILNKKRGQEINFSPNITIKIEASESDNIESRIQKAVDAALKQAFKEFGALFDSGVAY